MASAVPTWVETNGRSDGIRTNAFCLPIKGLILCSERLLVACQGHTPKQSRDYTEEPVSSIEATK
jgi:hypothetical protein